MKSLKKSLSIVIALILTLSTGVYAYTGEGDVDPSMSISMPSTLSEGKGDVAGAGSFSYQFVEISEEKYNEVKLIEARYDLMTIYTEWAADPTSESMTTKYNKACEEFEAKYGEKVSDILARYEQDPQLLTLIRNDWIASLTNFDDSNWTIATGSSISVDLTTFKGTKYFIGWIKTGDVYDAEVYKVVGTKTDKTENTVTNNTVENNTVKNNTVENNTVANNTVNNTTANNAVENNTVANNTTPVTSTKTDNSTPVKTITKPKADTTTTESQALPYTGVSDVIVPLMVVAGVAAAISYRKYKDIK